MVGGTLAGVGNGKAGEQHHHLGGDRDAGRADRHQREYARQPRVAYEVRGGIDQRLGDRCQDEHAPGNDTVVYRAGGWAGRLVERRSPAPGRYRAAQMRVWIDLTNSPHVLVMRPVIERLERGGPRGGGDRARLRPDARAVRALRDCPHRDRTPSGRAVERQGDGAFLALRRRSCAGRGHDASTSRSAMAPTT